MNGELQNMISKYFIYSSSIPENLQQNIYFFVSYLRWKEVYFRGPKVLVGSELKEKFPDVLFNR